MKQSFPTFIILVSSFKLDYKTIWRQSCGWSSNLTKPFFYTKSLMESRVNVRSNDGFIDIFIQRSNSREWDNSMIMRLHWQQITNWFESRRTVSQQRGANRRGEEHTSPSCMSFSYKKKWSFMIGGKLIVPEGSTEHRLRTPAHSCMLRIGNMIKLEIIQSSTT